MSQYTFIIMFFDGKRCENAEKMILTSEQHAKHLLASQGTQQLTLWLKMFTQKRDNHFTWVNLSNNVSVYVFLMGFVEKLDRKKQ